MAGLYQPFETADPMSALPPAADIQPIYRGYTCNITNVFAKPCNPYTLIIHYSHVGPIRFAILPACGVLENITAN